MKSPTLTARQIAELNRLSPEDELRERIMILEGSRTVWRFIALMLFLAAAYMWVSIMQLERELRDPAYHEQRQTETQP